MNIVIIIIITITIIVIVIVIIIIIIIQYCNYIILYYIILLYNAHPVGAGEDDDAGEGVEAVHLDEQLVERVLPLVVAPPEPALRK